MSNRKPVSATDYLGGTGAGSVAPLSGSVLLAADDEGFIVKARSNWSRFDASSVVGSRVKDLFRDSSGYSKLRTLLAAGADLGGYAKLVGEGILAVHDLADGRLTYDAVMDFGDGPFSARVVERLLADDEGMQGSIQVITDAGQEYGPPQPKAGDGLPRLARFAKAMVDAHPRGAAILSHDLRIESANERFRARQLSYDALSVSARKACDDGRPVLVSSRADGAEDVFVIVPVGDGRFMVLQRH